MIFSLVAQDHLKRCVPHKNISSSNQDSDFAGDAGAGAMYFILELVRNALQVQPSVAHADAGPKYSATGVGAAHAVEVGAGLW